MRVIFFAGWLGSAFLKLPVFSGLLLILFPRVDYLGLFYLLLDVEVLDLRERGGRDEGGLMLF